MPPHLRNTVCAAHPLSSRLTARNTLSVNVGHKWFTSFSQSDDRSGLMVTQATKASLKTLHLISKPLVARYRLLVQSISRICTRMFMGSKFACWCDVGVHCNSLTFAFASRIYNNSFTPVRNNRFLPGSYSEVQLHILKLQLLLPHLACLMGTSCVEFKFSPLFAVRYLGRLLCISYDYMRKPCANLFATQPGQTFTWGSDCRCSRWCFVEVVVSFECAWSGPSIWDVSVASYSNFFGAHSACYRMFGGPFAKILVHFHAYYPTPLCLFRPKCNCPQLPFYPWLVWSEIHRFFMRLSCGYVAFHRKAPVFGCCVRNEVPHHNNRLALHRRQKICVARPFSPFHGFWVANASGDHHEMGCQPLNWLHGCDILVSTCLPYGGLGVFPRVSITWFSLDHRGCLLFDTRCFGYTTIGRCSHSDFHGNVRDIVERCFMSVARWSAFPFLWQDRTTRAFCVYNYHIYVHGGSFSHNPRDICVIGFVSMGWHVLSWCVTAQPMLATGTFVGTKGYRRDVPPNHLRLQNMSDINAEFEVILARVRTAEEQELFDFLFNTTSCSKGTAPTSVSGSTTCSPQTSPELGPVTPAPPTEMPDLEGKVIIPVLPIDGPLLQLSHEKPTEGDPETQSAHSNTDENKMTTGPLPSPTETTEDVAIPTVLADDSPVECITETHNRDVMGSQEISSKPEISAPEVIETTREVVRNTCRETLLGLPVVGEIPTQDNGVIVDSADFEITFESEDEVNVVSSREEARFPPDNESTEANLPPGILAPVINRPLIDVTIHHMSRRETATWIFPPEDTIKTLHDACSDVRHERYRMQSTGSDVADELFLSFFDPAVGRQSAVAIFPIQPIRIAPVVQHL